MDEEELKPCPFCGGTAYLWTAGEYFFVSCVDCEVETRDCLKKEEAISNWNTRTNG